MYGCMCARASLHDRLRVLKIHCAAVQIYSSRPAGAAVARPGAKVPTTQAASCAHKRASAAFALSALGRFAALNCTKWAQMFAITFGSIKSEAKKKTQKRNNKNNNTTNSKFHQVLHCGRQANKKRAYSAPQLGKHLWHKGGSATQVRKKMFNNFFYLFFVFIICT